MSMNNSHIPRISINSAQDSFLLITDPAVLFGIIQPDSVLVFVKQGRIEISNIDHLFVAHGENSED